MKFCAWLVSLGMVGSLVSSAGDDITIASAPPVVVKTMPEAGSTGVDSKTTEIHVTFSKEMMDNTWSWNTASRTTFPKTSGQARYEKDKRTCVLPVELEPDKTYAIWVNSANFGNFKDARGQSAVPYLLVFETKKGSSGFPVGRFSV